MALIASVNGKPVYSDKRMTGIINSRITFSDGSWCDVSTGDVHSVGSGYIKIGGTDSDSNTNASQVTVGPRRVSASSLEMNRVAADIHVEVHSANDIEHTITGPDNLIKNIRATVRDNTLVIEGGGSGKSGGGVTIVQSGGGVTIGGNGVYMSNVFGRNTRTTIIDGRGSGGQAVKITIKVPRGTPVNSNQVKGSVRIGDTHGPLVASVQGDDVHAGRVSDAVLSVQGTGDIEIKEVYGTVQASVQGTGDIEIKNGIMPSLVATVQGTGDIKIGGSANTANLTVMGTGDIRVAHVRQRPQKTVLGVGDIKVRSVG